MESDVAVVVKDSSSSHHHRLNFSSSSKVSSTSTSTSRGGADADAGGISALQQLSELATASNNGNGTNHAGGDRHVDQRSTAMHGLTQAQASPAITIDTTCTPLNRTMTARPTTRNHSAATRMTQTGSAAHLIASTPDGAGGATARSNLLTRQMSPASVVTTSAILLDLNPFAPTTSLVPSHDFSSTLTPAPAPIIGSGTSVSPNSTSAQQQHQHHHHHRPGLSHTASLPSPYSNSLLSHSNPPRPILPSPRSLPLDHPPLNASPPLPEGSSPDSTSIAASQDDIDLSDPNEPYSKSNRSGAGLKTNKRAVQNRAAQRAFRERRENRMKDLETKAGLVEEYQTREQKYLQRIDQLEHELSYKPFAPSSSSSTSSPCSKCQATAPHQDLPTAQPQPLPPLQHLTESPPPLTSSSNDPSFPSLHQALQQSRQQAYDLQVQIEALKTALDQSRRICSDLRTKVWEFGNRDGERKEVRSGSGGGLGGEGGFTATTKGSGTDVDVNMDVNVDGGDMKKRCRKGEEVNFKDKAQEWGHEHLQVQMQTFPMPLSKKARVWE